MDIRLHDNIIPVDLPRVHACTHVDKVIRVLVCMYKDYKFLSMFSDITGCYCFWIESTTTFISLFSIESKKCVVKLYWAGMP